MVLAKTRMTHSGYEQPLPPWRAPLAATAHDTAGRPIPGKWHTYPEMAAAGLWTTPSDRARFLIQIQRSKMGKSNRVLSAELVGQMLTPQTGDYGLGLRLEGTGAAARFSHGGSNAGFRCIMI